LIVFGLYAAAILRRFEMTVGLKSKMFRKKIFSLISAFLITSIFPSLVFPAANVIGGQTFAYNPNPVTSAMGDAGTALLSDKVCSAILNPASTIGSYRIVASVSNSLIFKDIQYNYLGAQFPTEIGKFGFSFMYVGLGNKDYLNNSGNSIKMGSTNDIGFILNYSIDLKKTIPLEVVYSGLGINIKALRSSLGDYISEVLAADVGAIFILPQIENFSLGIAYKNLGPKIKFISEGYDLPQTLAFGTAYHEDNFYNLKVALDYNMQTYSGNFFSAGTSISPIYFLSLRGGVKLTDESHNADVRVGFGLEFENIMIDYSYSPEQKLGGGTHNINLSWAVGKFNSQRTAYDYYMQNHFREAVGLYRKKDFIAARQKFYEILAVYPGHAPSKEYLGKIEDALNAVDEYRASIVNKYMKRGNKALEKGDVIEARKNFEYVLELDSENALANDGIEKIEDYTRMVSIEKAKAKNKKSIEYLWNRAQKFYKKGELVHSKESLGFILDMDPENTAAKKEITNIDNQLSKIASDKVTEIYNQGMDLFNKGNFEDAIRYFEAVVIAVPQRMDVRELIEKAKKNIEEIAQYERTSKVAVTQDKVRGELESIFEKALSYYNKNDLEAAVKYFKESKELADKYEFKDYSAKSQNYISKVNKDLSDIYYKKGFELYRKNKFEAAAKEYKVALRYNSSNTSALLEYDRVTEELAQKYYKEGMVFYSKGDFAKSRELFKIALTYKPDKIEVKRFLDRIR
jgi:tetratricopeptide (TPR) repeat protein